MGCGLATFCAHVSGLSYKNSYFSGFRSHTVYFVKTMHKRVSEQENVEYNRGLLT